MFNWRFLRKKKNILLHLLRFLKQIYDKYISQKF